MKILQYCQHVLGAGHFFRSLEIARALKAHEVVLVTGGTQIPVSLPDHVREVALPALMMDAGFKTLLTDDARKEHLQEVKADRQKKLYALFMAKQPDLFLIELYPFGRKAFRFELDPILEAIQTGALKKTLVVCSLRDILVEKEDVTAYENRVLKTLKAYFDAVLVHSDPEVFKIDTSFVKTSEISVPIVYTGFVTPHPNMRNAPKIRRGLGLNEDQRLIVAGIGGGHVGAELLFAAINALPCLKAPQKFHLQIFCGPFMDNDTFKRLQAQRAQNITIERFTDHFPDYLAAADLSVSMAGYNTCMNILAAKVPALVRPFDQNREQRMRAEQLAQRGPITVLTSADLKPQNLAALMERQLEQKHTAAPQVDLNGALNTARWVENLKNHMKKEM